MARVPPPAARGALLVLLACSGAPPADPLAAARPARVDAEAELALGRAAWSSGDAARARRHLEAAISEPPRNAFALMELAEILLSEGVELGQAALLLEEAARTRGENPRLHRLRGSLLEQRGERAAAAEAYARSLSLREDAEVRLRHGLLLGQLGRTDEAIAELERVRAERAGDLQVASSLAELYERAGRAVEAARELEALARGGRDPAALRRLAELHARLGDLERARAIEAEARDLEVHRRELRPLRPSSR